MSKLSLKYRLGAIGLGILLLLLIGNLVGPYFTIYSFSKAIQEKDANKIVEYVDFEKVRGSVKSQVLAAFHKSLGEEVGDNPFSTIGMAFGSALIDTYVESFVSKEGILHLFSLDDEAEKPSESSTEIPNLKQAETKTPDYEIEYISFSKRRIIFENDKSEQLTLIIERFGLGWKIVDIRLPLDSLSSLQNFENQKNERSSKILKVAQITKKSRKNATEKNGLNNQYFSKVRIYGLEAKRYSTFSNKNVAGVKFKLRNEGKKTLGLVKVATYFGDEKGQIIFEKVFTPVNVEKFFDASDPLKPNYIWQLEKDKFFPIDNMSDEWKLGEVKAEVIDVEFLD
ncbi:MAG: DUF2939 domain-containing protein [Parvibaculales bacterium]